MLPEVEEDIDPLDFQALFDYTGPQAPQKLKLESRADAKELARRDFYYEPQVKR